MNPKDQKILSLIKELDKEVPTEGAVVKFEQYGGGPDESQIIANKKGYLRLGIKFLKAAFADPIILDKETKNGEVEDIEIELNDLVLSESDINFDWFQRTENIELKVYEPSFFSDKVLPFIVVAFIILLFFFAIKGCFSFVSDLM